HPLPDARAARSARLGRVERSFRNRAPPPPPPPPPPRGGGGGGALPPSPPAPSPAEQERGGYWLSLPTAYCPLPTLWCRLMAALRVVFMGSPAFAVPSLAGLLEAGHDVVLVLSQPDRPAGRGRQPTPPAVAAFARERGLPLFQPPSLKPPAAFARVHEAAPD